MTEPEPTENIEELAQSIAARGREALVERLRVAYAEAAATHADLVSLDDQRIEALVQGAADRADGLQWRRALAGVAAEQLGLSVTDALSHPAVARAQALVGAPSYEDSLAELMSRAAPGPPETGAAAHGGNGSAPAGDPGVEPADDPVVQPAGERVAEAVAATEPQPQLPHMPDPSGEETQVHEAQFGQGEPAGATEQVEIPSRQHGSPAAFAQPEELSQNGDAGGHDPEAQRATSDHQELSDQQELQEDDSEPQVAHDELPYLQVAAIHLGGVANLPTKREGLSVRVSEPGLDILQGEEEILGRLVWQEIEALQVPDVRVRRRRPQPRARLVVRTPHGDASFEVPGLSCEELRELVEPLVARYAQR